MDYSHRLHHPEKHIQEERNFPLTSQEKPSIGHSERHW